LIITGSKRYEGLEFLEGESIHNCGKGVQRLLRGLDWLAAISRWKNRPRPIWKYYYLCSRAGRASLRRLILRPERLVRQVPRSWSDQNKFPVLARAILENELVATSFALFLAKGRAVLINKFGHLPAADWNHDPDDVRNLVGIVSRD
jgi:hypothetical protein